GTRGWWSSSRAWGGRSTREFVAHPVSHCNQALGNRLSKGFDSLAALDPASYFRVVCLKFYEQVVLAQFLHQFLDRIAQFSRTVDLIEQVVIVRVVRRSLGIAHFYESEQVASLSIASLSILATPIDHGIEVRAKDALLVEELPDFFGRHRREV